MSNIKPDQEFILNNYKKTLNVIKDPNLSSLLQDYEERYMLCPASRQSSYYSAFPGGLAYHNLFVLFWAKKFCKFLSVKDLSEDSIVKVSILHEIGKLGTLQESYFIPQKSSWHREKGIYYEINPNISFMKIPHRSLFWAQKYKISLTQDEYLAILLNNDYYNEENIYYKYKESQFVLLFQQATQWARKLEKENNILWPKQ